MAITTLRFNKSTLQELVEAGTLITVKDTIILGLRFKVGQKRSVFQYEKRISGKSGMTGKTVSPVTFTIGAFPAISIDEARQEARRIANLCEKGIDPREEMKKTRSEINGHSHEEQAPPVVTLSEAIKKFFELKAELAPTTIRKYWFVTHFQFNQKWMAMDINAITAEMIVEQFHAVRPKARDRCWEMITVFGNIWTSTSLCFMCDGETVFGKNPIPQVRQMLKGIKRDQPKRSVIYENLLGKFVVTVERLREGLFPEHTSRSLNVTGTYDIILLCLFTALRPNEARCLRWEYLDLEQGVIRLPARTKAHAFTGTKNHHDHWVSLSSYIWEKLQALHESRRSMSPYVFPSQKNHAIPVTIDLRVSKWISEIMGTHYSPHASRRTFATIADEAGLGYLAVKRMLNHAFQGGVTGGYVVPGFNPTKERVSFQKVCDYILDRRAEYLGQVTKSSGTLDRALALDKLRRFALELGLEGEVVKGEYKLSR